MVINVLNDNKMKKEYIFPEIEVVELKAQHQLLAGSEIPTSTTPENPANSDAPGFDFEF